MTSMIQLPPSLLQPLDADRLRGTQFLREEAHKQLFQYPAELQHADVLRAFAFGHQASVALVLGFELCQMLGIAGGVGSVFI